MATTAPFKQVGSDTIRQVLPIDIAKQIIKVKIIQRVMRGLKTTPVGVTCFAASKTKNILFAQEKEQAKSDGVEFDKKQSAYFHMYDQIPLTKEIDLALLEKVDEIEPDYPIEGDDPLPADAFSAFILGMTELERMEKFGNHTTRELYILTDGESRIDWDRWEDAVTHFNMLGITLHVIGFNFTGNDPDLVPSEATPSPIKAANEAKWREVVAAIELPSTLNSFSRYLETISRPQVQLSNSRNDNMTLTLGDVEDNPDDSLRIHVVVKKAVTAGKTMTMKQMSLRSFGRATGNNGPRDRQDEEDRAVASTSKLPALKASGSFMAGSSKQYQLGDLGRDLKRTLSAEGRVLPSDGDSEPHGVSRERRHYYMRTDTADNATELSISDQMANGKAQDFVHGKGGLDDGVLEDATDADLTDAYPFGGSLIPVTQMSEDMGKLGGLKVGMEIMGFQSKNDIRYDWRMEDLRYVHAQVGQTSSALLFSALINGMIENGSVAVTRLVGKGMRIGETQDPQVGILFPVVKDGIEFCYWCRLPFAEDIRLVYFPSLVEFRNLKGKIIKEHKLIATQSQKDAMDDFVDSLSLAQSSEPDGEPKSWFNIKKSYSPGIHNINNTLMFRITNPEGELPPVHPALTKYLDQPQHIVDAASKQIKRLAESFDTKIVPPKPKRINKGKKNLQAIDNHEANPDDLVVDSDDEENEDPPQTSSTKADSSFPNSQSQTTKVAGSASTLPTTVEDAAGSSQLKVKDEDTKEPEETPNKGDAMIVDEESESDAEPDTEEE